MDKNIEVELRALLPDLKQFENTILKHGAVFKASSYICDVYFCEKTAASVEDVEMNDVGSYSLRLRKAEKNGLVSTTINTKTIITKGDHNAWEEHESEVGNFDEVGNILTRTEFKPFFKLEKTRRAYAYEGLEILIEDITDFGGAVEIEIMARPGEEEVSKQRIRKFLENVGIHEGAIVPKSITNIIMKERAFKQAIIF
jgi:predicted adenylyl cyclase CyaB